MGVNYKGFQIQGNISADNKVKVIDISENKSFNPIKHVRWYMTPQIITEGDDYSLVDPLHLFEGFEWYISRETIGHYLNVIIFRGNSIKKSEINIIQAKDLHFNGLKKLINHEEYSKDLINSNLNSEIDPDLDKYITEETIIG